MGGLQVSFLSLQAYSILMHFDLYLARGNLAALYQKVRNYPIGTSGAFPDVTASICAGVNVACVWYWKEVLCLQRSAATACMLKRYGVPAKMLIGAKQMPFKSHAWVEVDGRVVSDKPYM